jgi:hypothetical protein
MTSLNVFQHNFKNNLCYHWLLCRHFIGILDIIEFSTAFFANAVDLVLQQIVLLKEHSRNTEQYIIYFAMLKTLF